MIHRPSRCARWALVLSLLVAGAAAPPSLSLLPSATAQDGAAEMERLSVELRMESIERVVGSIVARVRRVAPEKTALVEAKLRPGEAFARTHATSNLETMLDALFQAELASGALTKEHIKVDLHLFRAYDGGAWQLRPVKDVPTARTGFQPPRSAGYPAEVATIDASAPHSMHDLGDYLADRFTHATLERIVREGRPVEIHLGGPTEALQDLVNRRFELLGEVKTPQGSYERVLLARSPQGELRYVITGTVDGLDRMRHLAALLRFAGKDRRGVANDKLTVVGDVEALKARTARGMTETLSRTGAGGTMAIVGFKASLRRELMTRALLRRGAEYLRDVLGADPYEGLKAKLAAERDAATGPAKESLAKLVDLVANDAKLATGLRTTPELVLTTVEGKKALATLETKLLELSKKYPASATLASLHADGQLRLPGGASAKEATIGRDLESGSLKAEELRVTTSRGVEPLKLVSNYYGDAMGDLVKALIGSGHRTIAYFGTAGGTGPGVKIGDIHVPSSVYDFRFELASGGVKNAFLEYFAGRSSSLGNRLNLDTKLGNVYSPAEETMAWLEETRTRGIGAVEVENSYITREVARHNGASPADPVKLFTSVIISDIPGSEHTLGNNNGATSNVFEKMVDHYLDALGVKDIAVTAKDASRFPNRPLAADPLAARLLEVADKLVPRNAPKSTFLRDRIAGLLSSLPAETIEAIDTSKKLKPKDIPGLSPELRAALDAEVAGAYTDADMVERLRATDGLVSRLSAELAKRHPAASYELLAGGGLERGSFSPNAGLTLEVKGDPAAAATAAELLATLRGEFPGVKVTLGAAGPDAVSLGRGEAFRADPELLVREHASRALTRRGVALDGTSVSYSGREHDPTSTKGTLYSRFELAATGPVASAENIRAFLEKLGRYDARVEWVSASDPRLAGGQARTIVDAAGKTVVLLPREAGAVRRYALIDELTHVIQLDRMRRKLGAPEVVRLFTSAERGDPASISRLLAWELEAKKMVRLMLPEGNPDRGLLDREVARIRAELDPYLAVRGANGKVDWAKVRATMRGHVEGQGSFILGLFLFELSRAVASGDRATIEAFFDGLATTRFWADFGLFVVGAEAGTLAYTKFLQRFVKPSFVNTVLKSNVALATGMALPMLVHGELTGRAFAVNLSGLMLSTAAVKAGLATLRWVVPLGELGARYQRLGRLLRVSRGVPGWVYAGVEMAVVLYFNDIYNKTVNAWLDERNARGDVTRAAATILRAARAARAADDPALLEAIDASITTYAAWRDRSLQPALAATAKLDAELERAGRAATIAGTGVSRFDAIASRYPGLSEAAERYRARNDAEVDAEVNAAVRRFEAERDAALRRAWTDGRRAGAYDPTNDAWRVSENRGQGYDDEAALYEAAAAAARDPAVARLLRELAATTRTIKERDAALTDPARAPPANTRGLTGLIHDEVDSQ